MPAMVRAPALVGWIGLSVWLLARSVAADEAPPAARSAPTVARLREAFDQVWAIDTHDHLRPVADTPIRDQTDRGPGVTLRSLWGGSYVNWLIPVSSWPQGQGFDAWWARAHDDFDNVRATSFYRSLLPAFRDLYGVEFNRLDVDGLRALNDRVFENYQRPGWTEEVITERARIELMFIDPHWGRLQFSRAYEFSVPVLNVNTLLKSTHRDNFPNPLDNPWVFAERNGRKLESLDDLLAVIELVFERAVAEEAACLKTTAAYERSLRFEQTPRERAAAAFGRPWDQLTDDERRDFGDFMFWHLAGLSARHDLPFQVHTGDARLEGSNPVLLLNVIAANPETKFVLFHGGYPWVGETGAIAMRHKNVWIDSCWLPALSNTMARRAYQEWLDIVPSNRIMWGADCATAEAIYGATQFTRQCLAEALAEKVDRGELDEADALRIGRQILRENALELFPKLRRRLRHTEAPAPAG